MLRLLLVAGLLAACGSDDDTSLHDVVTCDPAWTNQTGGCERACQMVPGNFGSGSAADVQCNASNPDFGALQCPRTFTFEGVLGCCVPDVPTKPVRFFECQ